MWVFVWLCFYFLSVWFHFSIDKEVEKMNSGGLKIVSIFSGWWWFLPQELAGCSSWNSKLGKERHQGPLRTQSWAHISCRTKTRPCVQSTKQNQLFVQDCRESMHICNESKYFVFCNEVFLIWWFSFNVPLLFVIILSFFNDNIAFQPISYEGKKMFEAKCLHLRC